jgi:hypothetical protein
MQRSKPIQNLFCSPEGPGQSQQTAEREREWYGARTGLVPKGSQDFPMANRMTVHRWDETAFLSVDTLEGNSIHGMRKWAVWWNYVGHGDGDGWLHVALALEVMKMNQNEIFA